MVRIIKRLEFAHLCITFRKFNQTASLTLHSSPSLSLLTPFGLKSPYTLSIHYVDSPLCFPMIIKENMCDVAQSS